MELYPLPPGVRAETFTCANGRQETVYRAPFESEGPRLIVEDGRKVLYYMYAAYVFRWPQDTTRLDIGHGTIDNHMDLWPDVSITGIWNPQTLTRFAAQWTDRELRKFSRGSASRQ